jgi:hypothetical protein
MKTTNQNLIILLAVGVIALIILYSNHSQEGFEIPPTEPTSCDCKIASMPIRYIRSKYIGVVVDVMSADGATVGDINSDYLVLVKKAHSTQSLQANGDGTLSLSIPNGADKNQLWQIKKIENAQDLKNLDNNIDIKSERYPFHVVVAKNSVGTDSVLTLHYENGNLAARPLGDYTAQHWEVSFKAMTSNSVPFISSGAHSIFSSELDKSASSKRGVNISTGYNMQTLNDMNSQISDDVKKALKEIITTCKNDKKTETPSTSLFGEEPFKITFKLGKGLEDIVSIGKEKFANSGSDVNSLLSRYETTQDNSQDKQELEGLINGTNVCKTPNMDEWVSRESLRNVCSGCAI